MTAENCGDPQHCPVPPPQGFGSRLSTVSIGPGDQRFSTYAHAYRGQLFNRSGLGDSRFSPLTQPNGAPLGSVYLARNEIGALLETVFHEITPAGSRGVSIEADLAGRAMRTVAPTERILLGDLRDPALAKNGRSRDALVSCGAAHYPCTREWAQKLRSARPGGQPIAGLIWNSRVTEVAETVATATVAKLLTSPLTEVCVLFEEHVNDKSFASSHLFDLDAGDGLTLVTDLALQLGGFVDQ